MTAAQLTAAGRAIRDPRGIDRVDVHPVDDLPLQGSAKLRNCRSLVASDYPPGAAECTPGRQSW
jgi:hypothetical protein